MSQKEPSHLPELTISKTQARRFLLAHHNLFPPRQLIGKQGILDYLQKVGCIQFDPVNVVGRNPDLLLQARIANYQPQMLEELSYRERLLMDGWDKQAAILLTSDWPYFVRQREANIAEYDNPNVLVVAIAPQVLEAIYSKGPLSSLELEHTETVEWWWGNQTRVGRAALEILFGMGKIGIHHRVASRRYFDLIERLLPVELQNAVDPNPDDETYQEWHVLRRVGGLGLAQSGAGEHWLGMRRMKSVTRLTVLNRLVDQGRLIPLRVEGIDGRIFYIRKIDKPTMDTALSDQPIQPSATILPPLDNLLWDRNLIRLIFDYDYIWEVYKPPHKRRFGHYTLPLLYGDRFIARFDPKLDRKKSEFSISSWWWEEQVEMNPTMEMALIECLRDFTRFLSAGYCHDQSGLGYKAPAFLSVLEDGIVQQ